MDNQSSADPPLPINEHGHGNNTRESLSNPLGDTSSVGSVPQPNQITSSQSLPPQSMYESNIAMDVTNANTMYNASIGKGYNHKQSPTEFHTQQLPSHSYAMQHQHKLVEVYLIVYHKDMDKDN